MNKLYRCSFFISLMLVLVASSASADSPWTENESYLGKTGGKFLYGLKNGVFFWLQPFKEAKSECYESDWTGFMNGIGQGVHFGVSGLIQLATFPIPVDFPDYGTGLTEVPAACPQAKSAGANTKQTVIPPVTSKPAEIPSTSGTVIPHTRDAAPQKKSNNNVDWESGFWEEPKKSIPATKPKPQPSPAKQSSRVAPKNGTIDWDEEAFAEEKKTTSKPQTVVVSSPPAAPRPVTVMKTPPKKVATPYQAPPIKTPSRVSPKTPPSPPIQVEDIGDSRDDAMDEALSELLELEAAIEG